MYADVLSCLCRREAGLCPFPKTAGREAPLYEPSRTPPGPGPGECGSQHGALTSDLERWTPCSQPPLPHWPRLYLHQGKNLRATGGTF